MKKNKTFGLGVGMTSVIMIFVYLAADKKLEE